MNWTATNRYIEQTHSANFIIPLYTEIYTLKSKSKPTTTAKLQSTTNQFKMKVNN